jgi:hypothetical protein
MPGSSNDEERRRLADEYAGKTDAELEVLANDGPSLTGLAREGLRTEILRRGLNIPVLDVPAAPPSAPLLPIIRVYRDLPDALIAQSILDSAEIDCFLFDENIVRLNWLWSYVVGGVKLRVLDEEAADAVQLLDTPRLEKFDVEGVGEFVQPRCPNCQSFEISFRPLIKRIAYGCLWFSLAIPARRPAWKCHSCGFEWLSGEPGEQLPLNWTLIRILWIWGLGLNFAALLNHYGSVSKWFWMAYTVVSAVCLARFAVKRKFTHAFLVGLFVDGWGFLISELYESTLSDFKYPIFLFMACGFALVVGALGSVGLMVLTWVATLFIPERKHDNEPR